MSSYSPYHSSPNKGKMFSGKGTIKQVGQASQKPALKARMKQDDSAAVNMSDNRLGKGVR
jgi:hypothetical protein